MPKGSDKGFLDKLKKEQKENAVFGLPNIASVLRSSTAIFPFSHLHVIINK